MPALYPTSVAGGMNVFVFDTNLEHILFDEALFLKVSNFPGIYHIVKVDHKYIEHTR